MTNPVQILDTHQRQHESSMLPVVLSTNQIPREVANPLDSLAQLKMGGRDHLPMSRQELLNDGMMADVIALVNQGEVCVDEELLDAAPLLKIVANVSIGTDNLDLDALTRRGIWATNAPGFFAAAVAEYVVAGMIVVSRRLLEADSFVRAGKWSHFEPGRWDGYSLQDKTLGIVGFGQIGQILATKAKGLGMRVLTSDKDDGIEELLPMLGECDFVSIHVPLTHKTRHLISRRELDVMKPNAILVDTSRGGVVDQQALVGYLEEGRLGGAILDVFEHEPNTPESLRSMSNVLLTPHVGGGTVESRRSTRLCAFQNVAAALRNERPPNALNNIEIKEVSLISND